MVGWFKMKLGMPVGLGPGHIALDWDPAELPSSKRGRSPQFSTHIYGCHVAFAYETQVGPARFPCAARIK